MPFRRAASTGAALTEIERRLDVLAPLFGGADTGSYARRQLVNVIEDLFRTASQAVDVSRLEAGARAQVNRDFTVIRWFFAQVAVLGIEKFDPPTEDVRAAVVARVGAAKASLDLIERQFDSIDALDLGMRLELGIDSTITRPLGLLARPSHIVDTLVASLQEKLTLLTQAQRDGIWAAISREVQPAPETDLLSTLVPLDDSIIPPGFFGPSTPPERLAKTARYLADLRPRLVEAGMRRGQKAFPLPRLAVAQALSWTADSVDLSVAERRLAAHLAFLAFLATKRLRAQGIDLAAALGVDPTARLVNATPRLDAKAVPESATTAVAIAELRAAIAVLHTLVSAAPEPEIELLVRYKLAAEVELPGSRGRFAGRGEVELQKALCAYLIGHGSYAIGTKFGPAETDLVTGSAADPLIIEVKLYKKPPSPRALELAVIQLLGYMDLAPFRSRGALVLLNLSDVPVLSPKEFIGARIAVIPVNLPIATPSVRERSILVQPSISSGRLVDVLVVDGSSTRARSKKGRTRS